MRRSLAVAAAAILSACGGGTNTTTAGTFSGTVGGAGLQAKDAIFLVDETSKVLTVFLGEDADLCTRLKSGRLPRSASYLALALRSRVMSEGMLRDQLPTNGSFGVGAYNAEGGYADLTFTHFADNCLSKVSGVHDETAAGTLTLTKADTSAAGNVIGTFSATVEGSAVSGSFTARSCDLKVLPEFGCL